MGKNGVAKLRVYGGPDDGATILLTGNRITLGRLKANDVSLRDVGVSRLHAAIEKTDDGFVLRDLNSTNGTFVNHEHIGLVPYLLRDGDTVTVAPSPVSFLFKYELREEPKGTGRTVPTIAGKPVA
jgi:pSer/pThr/pTyr-binding forkhead associated (FHA) protein